MYAGAEHAAQVLGKVNCSADIATFSGTSRDAAEKPFHHFCEKLSAGLCKAWVTPLKGDDIKNAKGDYC